MRKLKKLLPALMAIVMALALVFSVACSGSCKPASNNEPVKTLQSITLDAAQAKTEYEVGDEYSSEGLKVTANFKTGNEESTENVALTDENLSIDSSGYVKATEGTYTIKVSYTNGGVTKTAEYDVTVVKHVAGPGLKVTLAEGTSDTIELSGTATTATIDLNKIKVEVVDEKGATLATLTPAEYTVELYKGTEKLTSASGLKGGVYQIWAKANKGYVLDYDWRPDDFVIVYVVNNVVSLAWENKESASFEQMAGDDEITSSWHFTATYADGTTKDVTDSVVYTPEIDTGSAGQKTTTVSYTEKNQKSVDVKVTLAEQVSYTITKRPVPTGTVTYTIKHYINEEGQWVSDWSSTAGTQDAYLNTDHDGYVTVAVKKDEETLDTTTKSESSSKTYTDPSHPENNRTVKQYAEFKTSRYGEIVVSKYASNVSIAFYAWNSQSNSTTRVAYIGTALPTGSADVEGTDYTITERGNLPAAEAVLANTKFDCADVQRVSKDGLSAGTYYVTANNTYKVSEIDVVYTVDYSKIKTTFDGSSLPTQNTDDKFLTDEVTWTATNGSSTVTLVSKSGKASKITDKSSYSQKIEIDGVEKDVSKFFDTQGNTGVVKLTLTQACKITYYATSSSDDATRYIVLKNAGGTEVYNTAGTDELVARGKDNVVAYTIDVTAEMIAASEGGVFTLGTKSGGCYIYAIVIS